MPQKITIQTIGDAISIYPEEVRESVKQIFGYMQDKCGNDRNRLVSKLKMLGHDYSAFYFYALFTGRYMKNGKFTASVEQINKIAKDLRDSELGKFVEGRFPPVETETVRLFRDAVNAIRTPNRICKWLIVVGKSGSQKSYAAKLYATEYNHGSTIHLEAPSKPEFFGLRYALARRTGCAMRSKAFAQELHISESLTEEHCLIIDNAQRLYNPNTGNRQDCFSYLQKLQDETNCAIVLIFVRNTMNASGEKDPIDEILFGDAKGYFEQLIGRIGGKENILRLDNDTPDKDLAKFAKAAGFKNGELVKSMMPVMRYLDRAAGGVRILLQCLQDAAMAADAEGREVSLDDFIDTLPLEAMKDKQLARLEIIQQKALTC